MESIGNFKNLRLVKFFKKLVCIKTKYRREEEERIITRFTCLSYSSPDTLPEEKKLELANLQIKLDDLYSQRAKRALFFRSLFSWIIGFIIILSL